LFVDVSIGAINVRVLAEIGAINVRVWCDKRKGMNATALCFQWLSGTLKALLKAKYLKAQELFFCLWITVF
jgi:hypothetical protein